MNKCMSLFVMSINFAFGSLSPDMDLETLAQLMSLM